MDLFYWLTIIQYYLSVRFTQSWSTSLIIAAKFEVNVGADIISRHENIPVIWAEYLALLEEAKKQLEANKDRFKTQLLEQAEVKLNYIWDFFIN